MKKCFYLLFAALLTIGSLSAKGAGEEKEDGKTVIRFMAYNSESSRASYLKYLKEKLPHIEIQYEFVPGGSFDNVLNTQLAAGNGPDIIEGGSSSILLASAGYLKDLSGQEFLNRYHEASISALTVNDAPFAVPLQSWFSGIFYNKKFFKENGFEVPRSFEEYIELCKMIEKTGVKALANPYADGNNIAVEYISHALTSYYSTEESSDFDKLFNKGEGRLDESWKSAAPAFLSLIDEGIISQSDLGITREQAIELFVTGKAAMFKSGPWDINQLREKNPDLELAMFPHTGKAGEPGWLIGGMGSNLMVNNDTEKYDAVLEILELTSTAEAQSELIKDNTGSSYLKGVSVAMDPLFDDCKEAFMANNIHAPWVVWKAGTPVLETLGKSLQEVLAGSGSVESALSAGDKKNLEVLSSL